MVSSDSRLHPQPDNILEIWDLRTYFFTEAGVVKAVDGISLEVRKNETLGLVGESGSGKTVTALSILRTVPQPGKIIGGHIFFRGEDLTTKTEEEMRRIRGKNISMVFQDPSSSLNPLFSIGSQISSVIMLHQKVTKAEAAERAVELLSIVGISEPEKRIHFYPHELSGGMRQRVAIARALACQPDLLLADEPTTNLDVTIQAQVLQLLRDLKEKYGMSLVMITHDMGVIAEMAERVAVLYAGMVSELGDVRTIFKRSKHPYTLALLEAVPRIDVQRRLSVVPGNIPNLIKPPSGCRFHPRCKYATQICKEKVPPLEQVEPGHLTACHHWREL